MTDKKRETWHPVDTYDVQDIRAIQSLVLYAQQAERPAEPGRGAGQAAADSDGVIAGPAAMSARPAICAWITKVNCFGCSRKSLFTGWVLRPRRPSMSGSSLPPTGISSAAYPKAGSGKICTSD